MWLCDSLFNLSNLLMIFWIKSFVRRNKRWVRGSERWRNKLHNVKSGRAEIKNTMYDSVGGSAEAFFKRVILAATCSLSIPLHSLLLSFDWLLNRNFDLLYFFYSFLQQRSWESLFVKINRMTLSHSSPTNYAYFFKIPYIHVLLSK